MARHYRGLLVLCIAVQATLGGTNDVENAQKSSSLFPDIPLERYAAMSKLWSPADDFSITLADPAWQVFQDEVEDVQELTEVVGTEKETEMRFRVLLPPPVPPTAVTGGRTLMEHAD